MNLQHRYINDKQGNPEYVILSIAEYEALLLQATPVDDEEESQWQTISYESEQEDEHIIIPHQVVMLKYEHNTNLLGAWRIYRGLTQAEVAKQAKMSQSALSQAERKDSRPRAYTKAKLAKIYNCSPEQL